MNSREKAENWLAEVQQTEGAKFLYTEKPDIDSLTDLLDQHAMEQRQRCRDAIIDNASIFEDACLDASYRQ